MSTNLIQNRPGSQITFGTNSDTVAMTFKNLGAVYRQSAKFDFGAVWDQDLYLTFLTKLGTAPTAALTMDFWIGYSASATAATDNPANLGGGDAAYTGYNSDAINGVRQLEFLGSLLLCNVNTAQNGLVLPGWFTPRARYGILVWANKSGQTTTNVDADHQAVLRPVTPQIQAAV